MDDSDSDDSEEDLRMVFQLDEDAEAPPIEEDDPSLPLYDTDNRHSYVYQDATGPVYFSYKLMNPLDNGHELNGVHTSFHNFPLSLGDEVPQLKLAVEDNRVIKLVFEQGSYMISINCGEADSYAVACWLRDRSKAEDTAQFSMIDAVALEVISHADMDQDGELKKIAVCRVVGRVRLNRVMKSLTGLIFSDGVVTAPNTSQSFELATLSRADLALSPRKKEKQLHHVLSVNSRLVMQYSTSASIDRLFSVMTWIPNDVLEDIKKKEQWRVATFLMRSLPLDRTIHHILIKINSTDAQISILDSIDYSTLQGSCLSCDHELFRISDVVYLKPWASSAVFVNPAEYMFDTVILRHTIASPFGILDNSFSWFEGYGWRHIMCRGECHNHLGWRFESKTLRPSTFCALQRGRFRLVSDEIKLILDRYDCDAVHPNRFFRKRLRQ